MDRSLYRYILHYSYRQQLIVLALTAAALPFYYASLDVPKRIVNEAIGATGDKFPKQFQILGAKLAELPQIEFLIALCVLFLLLVLLNGAFKYVINVYKGLLGERMLRRLRYQLYALLLRFPISRFKKVSSGEMVSSISAEVEPLGGFIGDAFALPLYQGGLLLTALVFIFAQDLILGLLVVALYPIQAVVIPRLQYRVNLLGRQRVREVRRLSNKITETIQMARDIRSLDTDAYERANFTQMLGRIFDIRYDIYRKKFFIKFLNNLLAQLSRLLIFSIGGYLVIVGKLTLGELVAVLAAYKDLAPPWKELLDYYQMQQDARIRYEQILLLFDVEDLEAAEAAAEHDSRAMSLPGRTIALENLTASDDGTVLFGPLSVELDIEECTALVGDGKSGSGALTAVVAGLMKPTSGTIRIGDTDFAHLPQSLIRREFAYVDGDPAFFNGTVFENLVFGLKQRVHDHGSSEETPVSPRRDSVAEALITGNSPNDVDACWVDLPRLGLRSSSQLVDLARHALEVAGMSGELFDFGLRTTVDSAARPELAQRMLEARRRVEARLEETGFRGLVARFDRDRYNDALTIGENLIFGEPVGDGIDIHRMADNRHVRRVLRRTGVEDELVAFGYDIAVAALTAADGNGGRSEIDFIEEDDLPTLRTIVSKKPRSAVEALSQRDRRRLESVPLELVASRHGFFPIGNDLKARIVAARDEFEAGLPDELRSAIAFFDDETYNRALTVRENIVFGKAVSKTGDSPNRLQQLLEGVVDELNLRDEVAALGLSFHMGAGAARLTQAQRQQLGLARAILRKPHFLVLSDAISALDDETQIQIHSALRVEFSGRGMLSALPNATLAQGFDRMVRLAVGRIVEDSNQTSVAAGFPSPAT